MLFERILDAVNPYFTYVSLLYLELLFFSTSSSNYVCVMYCVLKDLAYLHSWQRLTDLSSETATLSFKLYNMFISCPFTTTHCLRDSCEKAFFFAVNILHFICHHTNAFHLLHFRLLFQLCAAHQSSSQ